jgi:Ca2+-binding EF-hand superfamily protein
MNITDDQLRSYINQIFARYDRDKSGSLDASELAGFFNDLFQMMGYSMKVN